MDITNLFPLVSLAFLASAMVLLFGTVCEHLEILNSGGGLFVKLPRVVPTFYSLQDVCKEYGVKNVRVLVPMRPLVLKGAIPGIAFRSSNHAGEVTECVIHEGRYTVTEGYKVELRALDYSRYGKETYYQSDLDSMIRSAADREDPDYRIFVLTIDGAQEVTLGDLDQGRELLLLSH